MRGAQTRRQLLVRGVGAAAGLSVIAPTVAQADSGDQARSKLPPNVQDAKTLQKLLDAERLLRYGYEHALGTGYLKHDARELALRQLAQEEAHVAALQARLRALHVPRSAYAEKNPGPFPPKAAADLVKIVKDERTALQVIVQIENVAESSYFTAVGSFNDTALVRLATEILACEAQHWTMLVGLLHKGDATKAVPTPYVRGQMQIGKPHTT
jgi:ferritin-like protein